MARRERLSLLGGHPRRRAHGGRSVRARFGDHLGDTEVEDLHRRAVIGAARPTDENVVGLDVAMHDVDGVRGADRMADLLEELGHFAHGERATRLDVGSEIFAVEKLHGHVGRSGRVVDARADDVDDVLAIDASTDARLLLEALAELGCPEELRVHHLDRAPPAGAPLDRNVHLAHPARGERLHDGEVTPEYRARAELRHCPPRRAYRTVPRSRLSASNVGLRPSCRRLCRHRRASASTRAPRGRSIRERLQSVVRRPPP